MEATAAGRKSSVPWNRPPAVRPPTTLERVFHRRLVARPVVRYATTGRQLGRGAAPRDVEAEPPPFREPPPHSAVPGRRGKQPPPADGHTHRSRQCADLPERLHVPDCEEDGPPPPPLLRVVEGRPVKEKLDLRRYVGDVRGNLVGRLEAGWLQDEALLLEERLRREQREAGETREALRSYADSLRGATAASHEQSMAVMRRYEQGAAQLGQVLAEHRELQRRQAAARARVYVLSEAWARCKLYQAFLYQASPVTWRQEHGILVTGTDSGLTAQHASKSLTDEDSLEVLISRFSADVTMESQPQLYFTEVGQLLELFTDMEHKNLDSLIHLESLSESLQQMRRVRKDVEESFEKEVSSMTAAISEFKSAIKWEEERAAELESHARKLMSTTFKDMVVSDDLLRLKVFVEDTYEAVIAKNESNLKMIDMKAAIEAKYDQLMLQLDRYPKSLVRDVQRQVFAAHERKTRAARDAEVKEQLMERLVRRLRKALEPTFVKTGKPVHFRSPPPTVKRKPKPKAKQLTQKQKDFLEFFTDYCQYTDSVGTYIQGF